MKEINRAISIIGLFGLCLLPVVAAAQGPPPPPPGGGFMGGPGPMGGPMGDIGEVKPVKGAPLSAEIVVTRETTLADGNHIRNESQSKVYRDSEGRVRREMNVDLATPATGKIKHNFIIINDPVAGARYMLNPDNKTARQMPMHGGPNGPGKNHAEHHGAGPQDPEGVTKEQLGTKSINGIQAEGVRVTRTIPAGEMGNEKPISVVTERWYSPDLQMAVMTVHTDPMMGTVTAKLVNVTPGAPDASLFQVPSDYTVQSGKRGDPMFVPMKP
jgi:hypothetical protein